jgi:dTDP-3-amino-3,4,6-trideoxy-alpha-D-glucose transaminase
MMAGLPSLARISLTRMDNDDPALFAELIAAVERVAASGHFIGGEEVSLFEQEFAAYCETSDAVGVASGTEALVLGLRALGVGAGTEVVVPANSFIATAEAVSLAGGVPRFADVDAETQLVTPATVERALSPKTRHVIVVHLYGRTVDMTSIADLADARGLTVIEDACQAHGARFDGQRVGSFGAFGAFSFYPAKNLGAWGDAGALVTSDPELADRVRLLRSHGERPRYHHQLIGTTGRLDALQAAILRVKLRQLDANNERRRHVARMLVLALAGKDVTVPAPVPSRHDHVYHQFVIQHRERDQLRAELARRSIDTGVHYPVPIHRAPAYAQLTGTPDPAPVASRLADRICSLPIHPALDLRSIERIADAVAAAAPVRSAV